MKNISKLMVALFIAIFLTTNSWTQKEACKYPPTHALHVILQNASNSGWPNYIVEFSSGQCWIFCSLRKNLSYIKEFNNSWKANKKPRC